MTNKNIDSNSGKPPRKEVKSFDRIIKENLEYFILQLSDRILNISIQESKPLELGLQTTIEREPDFIRWVKVKGKSAPYIIHIEFQTQDDPEMIYRMTEYRAILLRKFKVPIKQFVIYLGKGRSKMKTNLPEEQQIKGFQLYSLGTVPYTDFLNAKEPESVIMTVLSDFQGKDKSEIVEQILGRLQALVGSKMELNRYLTQLNVLARLRNLQEFVYQKIEAMPIIYDETKDSLYLKGEIKGRALEREELEKAFVINLLKKGVFTIEEIAQLSNTSVDFVSSIQRDFIASPE